jgi:UDP-N-acetylmuramoylalanine--D-glutamate ligase
MDRELKGRQVRLSGRQVLVVGLGRSGQAVARLLAGEGAHVTVTDQKDAEALKQNVAALSGLPIRFELGKYGAASFLSADLIVISPGVPIHLPLIQAAEARGIPVIGEIELAAGFISAPILAITGTNGKSTTSMLIGEILKSAGKKVFVGGNLGRPLSDAAESRRAGEKDQTSGPWDFVVAEVSSFQLERVKAFHPKIGVYLNLTPDHLDRHEDLSTYAMLKARLFENQGPEDFAVLNADDPEVSKVSRSLRSKVIWFSRMRPVDPGVYWDGQELVSTIGMKKSVIRQDDLRLKGVHNLENVLAAMAVTHLAGCDDDTIVETLKEFSGLEHRLEWVREKDDVIYINDSKGTNIGAAIRSLESFSRPIIWLAGGREKGTDFSVLREVVQSRVKQAILFGEARGKMKKALNGATRINETERLSEAIALAASIAIPGDVVLLSPACASFDQFRDFEERGNAFKDEVRRL